MLRKTIFAAVLISAAVIFPNHGAVALEKLIKGAPASVGTLKTPTITPDGPLTVIDVIVDKTAANAVLARDQAMAEAQRLAFQKLAERNLTPDEYKSFKAPDVKTIAALVQDFEIKGEQLSSTRYVANFTVRFRDAVRQFVHVDMPAPEMATMEALQGTDAGEELAGEDAAENKPAPDIVAVGPAKKYLILPYIETMSGKLLLWEDPNPWRQAWQQQMPPDATNGSSYVVPMGDIPDVSAGSTDAVWSGDYRAVEKLRQNYHVDEVVLAVANKSGAYMTIDMYFFRNGGLLKREVLQPYVGERPPADAFAFARGEVMKYLQNPASFKGKRTVENISRELTGTKTAAADVVAIPAAGVPVTTVVTSTTTTTATPAISAPVTSMPARGGKTEVEAMMSFASPATWMDLQKRVATLSPPVRLDIRSLNKGGAQFVMRYEGDINSLRSALATRGIALNQPSVEIDRSVVGGGQSGMKPVYGLQLTN